MGKKTKLLVNNANKHNIENNIEQYTVLNINITDD